MGEVSKLPSRKVMSVRPSVDLRSRSLALSLSLSLSLSPLRPPFLAFFPIFFSRNTLSEDHHLVIAPTSFVLVS